MTGAGNMGRGIGHRLVAGGHAVTVVDRDPEEAEQLAEVLRGAAEEGATVEAAEPGAELRGEVVRSSRCTTRKRWRLRAS